MAESQEVNQEGFISDEDMTKLEEQGEASSSPDFVSDEEMESLAPEETEQPTDLPDEIPDVGRFEAFRNAMARGLTFGGVKNMTAAAGALKDITTTETFDLDDFDKLYDIYMDKLEKKQIVEEELQPEMTAAGEVAAVAIPTGAAGLKIAGIGKRAILGKLKKMLTNKAIKQGATKAAAKKEAGLITKGIKKATGAIKEAKGGRQVSKATSKLPKGTGLSTKLDKAEDKATLLEKLSK